MQTWSTFQSYSLKSRSLNECHRVNYGLMISFGTRLSLVRGERKEQLLYHGVKRDRAFDLYSQSRLESQLSL